MENELNEMRAALDRAKEHANKSSGAMVVWSSSGPVAIATIEAVAAAIEALAKGTGLDAAKMCEVCPMCKGAAGDSSNPDKDCPKCRGIGKVLSESGKAVRAVIDHVAEFEARGQANRSS